MVSTTGTAVSVLPKWRFPNAGLRGHGGRNIHQANWFFTFISDTYETSSIIFTTNKEIMDWAEMLGDPVLTTALLDRILHHANCYSFRGESYRLKHPEMFT